MEIPFYQKDNRNDLSCAPVCLKMAFAYFGIERSLAEIYELTGAMGERRYALPWGICVAASLVGLSVTYISKNPYVLLDAGYDDVEHQTEWPRECIETKVQELLRKCKNGEPQISMFEWKPTYQALPQAVVRAEKGVVIPTLWWNGPENHNVVLTEFFGPNRERSVRYHDPNVPQLNGGPDRQMSERDFQTKWLDSRTDNDLFIISRERIDPNQTVARIMRDSARFSSQTWLACWNRHAAPPESQDWSSQVLFTTAPRVPRAVNSTQLTK